MEATMRWISRTHETLGIEWKEEGWFFDKPAEDYAARLRCKKCGSVHRIDGCRKNVARGYLGDDCGSPVFYLHCTKCYGTLAVIEENSGEFRPLLNLEKDGEFVNPPLGV
jgi:hypothetical protein